MRNRAAAIIIRNKNILLMRRQKPGRNYFILPGGGVEFGESFEEACIREVKEETGLDVLNLQLIYTFNNNGSEEHYFLTRIPPDEPVLGGSEADRQTESNVYTFEWVDADQLENTNLLPAQSRKICLEVLKS